MPDESHELAERVAVLEFAQKALEGQLTGSDGLRRRLDHLGKEAQRMDGRVSVLSEEVEKAVTAINAAGGQLAQIATAAAVEAGIRKDAERRGKTWVAPVITAVVVAAILGLAQIVFARSGADEALRAAAREAAQEATRETLRSVRVHVPSPPEVP